MTTTTEFKGVLSKATIIVAVIAVSLAAVMVKHPAHVSGASNGKIAFASDGGGSSEEIYTINPGGTGQQQLTNDNFIDFEPSWSPSGNQIAFVADPNSDGNFQIYIMNADGSNERNITNDSLINTDPKWSPDGTKIAFTQAADNSSPSFIYTMNVDGTNATKLTSNTNGDLSPAWNPAGTKIVYTCNNGSHDQLCVMSSDGTNQSALTADTNEHENASWSPDGTQIAFSFNHNPYDFSLDVMSSDGTNIHTIANGSPDSENITWSPDGTKFLYTQWDQVFYSNLDGSNVTAVTPTTESSTTAAWQPMIADSDGDGVPNSVEAAAPNNGDANSDGVGDQYQPQITGFVNPITNTYTVVQSSCSANNSASVNVVPASYKDSAFNYPQGLLNFTTTCSTPGATATVTLYYYGLTDSSSLVLRKYNTATHAYQTIPGVTISAVTIGGQSLTKAIYQITDGGPLDQDGTANRTIVDPVGIASPAVGAPNTGLGGMAYSR